MPPPPSFFSRRMGMTGPNSAGMGGTMGTACPNPPGLTKWASSDPSVAGKRPVDAVLGDMEEQKISCPDCDFTTVFQDSMKRHTADCERQKKIFEEREKSKGVSEEKVAEMIEKANQPIVSALNDIAALLVKQQAPKKPRKRKSAGSTKKGDGNKS